PAAQWQCSRRSPPGDDPGAQRPGPAVAGDGARPGSRGGRGTARGRGRLRVRGNPAGVGRSLLRPGGAKGGRAMMRSLAWKEYRDGWAVWLSLAWIGAGVVLMLPLFLDLVGTTEPGEQRFAVLITLIVLAITYGMVAASLLLAGEREAKTLPFL